MESSEKQDLIKRASPRWLNEPSNVVDQYLTEKDVSAITKRALSTLRNERSQGRGIPYIKCNRSVRYDLADVKSYMQAHRIQTSETCGA